MLRWQVGAVPPAYSRSGKAALSTAGGTSNLGESLESKNIVIGTAREVNVLLKSKMVTPG